MCVCVCVCLCVCVCVCAFALSFLSTHCTLHPNHYHPAHSLLPPRPLFCCEDVGEFFVKRVSNIDFNTLWEELNYILVKLTEGMPDLPHELVLILLIPIVMLLNNRPAVRFEVNVNFPYHAFGKPHEEHFDCAPKISVELECIGVNSNLDLSSVINAALLKAGSNGLGSGGLATMLEAIKGDILTNGWKPGGTGDGMPDGGPGGVPLGAILNFIGPLGKLGIPTDVWLQANSRQGRRFDLGAIVNMLAYFPVQVAKGNIFRSKDDNECYTDYLQDTLARFGGYFKSEHQLGSFFWHNIWGNLLRWFSSGLQDYAAQKGSALEQWFGGKQDAMESALDSDQDRFNQLPDDVKQNLLDEWRLRYDNPQLTADQLFERYRNMPGSALNYGEEVRADTTAFAELMQQQDWSADNAKMTVSDTVAYYNGKVAQGKEFGPEIKELIEKMKLAGTDAQTLSPEELITKGFLSKDDRYGIKYPSLDQFMTSYGNDIKGGVDLTKEIGRFASEVAQDHDPSKIDPVIKNFMTHAWDNRELVGHTMGRLMEGKLPEPGALVGMFFDHEKWALIRHIVSVAAKDIDFTPDTYREAVKILGELRGVYDTGKGIFDSIQENMGAAVVVGGAAAAFAAKKVYVHFRAELKRGMPPVCLLYVYVVVSLSCGIQTPSH